MREPTWNELIEEYKGTLKELSVIAFRMRLHGGGGKYWSMTNQMAPMMLRFGDDYVHTQICDQLDKWRDPIIP